MKGKYTVKSSGHCKYGGWNPDGIVRFNELKQLVAEDRVCPKRRQWRRSCLNFARRKMEAVEVIHKETTLQRLK
jgi:hypothetical protein